MPADEPTDDPRIRFEHFVATRATGLRRTAYLLTQDSHLADDLTQTALQPAGARLVGHAVSDPGQRSITFSVTPTTLNLAWSSDCWDPLVKGVGNGAGYRVLVNGKFLEGSSPCAGGSPDGPIEPAGSFGGGSPTQNAAGWAKYGVKVGEPFEVTLKLDDTGENSYRQGVAPQLAAAIFTRGPADLISGVWVDRESP